MNKHPSERRIASTIVGTVGHIGYTGPIRGYGAATLALHAALAQDAKVLKGTTNNYPSLLELHKPLIDKFLGPHEMDAEAREASENLARESFREGFNAGCEASIHGLREAAQKAEAQVAKMMREKQTEHTRKEMKRLRDVSERFWRLASSWEELKMKGTS